MPHRLHIHTDSAFFSGSENMLVNLLASAPLRGKFDVSFSYRWSAPYEEGLKRRVRDAVNAVPLRLADPAWLHQRSGTWPPSAKLFVRIFSGLLLLKYWMVIWNTGVLCALLRRNQPAILHINNGGYPGALSCLAAAIAGRLCGVPAVVMVVNNLAIPYRGLRRWFDYPVDRIVHKCVTRFVTGSGAAAAQLRDVLELPDEKVLPVHNGIALRRAGESAAQTRRRLKIADAVVCFGMVALIEPRKGHHVLLDAVEAIVSAQPDLAKGMLFLLEGTGPNKPAIEERVRRAGLQNHVRLTGVEDNIVDFMQAMDVILLPSVGYEDFPNVILEAMALGKPVIASRLAGIPEQVENERSGLLVEPGDAQALAAALLRLFRDAGMRESFGACGAERFASMFSAEISVSRYIGLYEELLKEKVV